MSSVHEWVPVQLHEHYFDQSGGSCQSPTSVRYPPQLFLTSRALTNRKYVAVAQIRW